MRNLGTSGTIAGAVALIAALGLSGQQAAALPGDAISVGGQILEPGNDSKISVGGFANHIGEGQFEGQLQINFHRVGPDLAEKSKFHGNVVTEMNFALGNSATCNTAMNMSIQGTLDGDPDYTVILRAGDAGAPGHATDAAFDTVRIELWDGLRTVSNVNAAFLVYDTTAPANYTDQSSCVGSARTGLDRGNLSIELQ